MLPLLHLVFICCVIFYDVHKSYRDLKASKEKRGFVMHISDDETNSGDSDSDVEADKSHMVSGRRFVCDDLYMRFELYYSFS